MDVSGFDPLNLTDQQWPSQSTKDRMAADEAEQQKVREFRRYMAEKNITKLVLKLYQFCNEAKKNGQYVEHVVQEFLATYPGESDGETDSLLESREKFRDGNVQLEKQIKKYQYIMKTVPRVIETGCKTWKDASDGFCIGEKECGDIGNTPFPWQTKNALYKVLERIDSKHFETNFLLWDELRRLHQEILDQTPDEGTTDQQDSST